jgi:Fur family peroxide stress response transcriptional regulator
VSKLRAELTGAFRAVALRPTPQRYAVLEFLVRHRLHATADEIFAALNRDDPRASRATVYNSLRALAHSGLVREVISDGKAARYDANVRRHHHFVCERCGGVEDIEWFDFPRTAGRPALGGRSVRTFEMLFRGICESCGPTNPNTGAR